MRPLVPAVLAALVVLATPPALAAANADPDDRRTFVLVRTTDGPSSYRLIVEAALGGDDPVGFVGTVSARVQNGRAVQTTPLGAYSFHWDYGVKTRAQGQTMQVCDASDGCIVQRTLAYNVGTFFDDQGGPDVDNRLYVTLEGPSRVRFEGSGWRLVEADVQYRYMEASQAGGSGVFTGAGGYQAFESAELAGGPRGSVAVGIPPCSTSSSAGSAVVPRGVGTAVLSGGKEQPSLTCPENVGRPFIGAVADATTTWRLAGPVVGDSTLMNVPLFVVDLPDDDELTRQPED